MLHKKNYLGLDLNNLPAVKSNVHVTYNYKSVGKEEAQWAKMFRILGDNFGLNLWDTKLLQH